MVFIPRAQPHAQSLFLFPIVFGINLIHFFEEKKGGAAGRSVVFLVLRSHVTPFDRSKEKNLELFRRVQRFWQRKVRSQHHSRGEKVRCIFLARRSAKFFANTKVQIFDKEKCKTHRQFPRYLGDVTSVSLSLCLSVSLSLTECTSRTAW